MRVIVHMYMYMYMRMYKYMCIYIYYTPIFAELRSLPIRQRRSCRDVQRDVLVPQALQDFEHPCLKGRNGWGLRFRGLGFMGSGLRV